MATGLELAIRDLAIVVAVAGATTLLFHRLKQPVVLGYLLAGFIVGPYSPGPHVESVETLHFLGELGIIFLLFALGLEFNLRKLRKVGLAAVVGGVLQIALMVALGYAIGRGFGWGVLESLFLGAVISISSTMIIVKVLAEQGTMREGWAQLAIGILLVEDVAAVILLTVLGSAGATSGFDPELLGTLAIKLGLFVGTLLVLGLLVLPRFTNYLARLEAEEVMVMAAIGVGFAVALLALFLGFSPGLGAFLAGALMAESPRAERIEHRIVPLRDVFSGIFFVTVGAAIVPAAIAANWVLVLVVTAAVVVGKVVGVSAGAFIAGRHPIESLRVGLSLAQVGEFSFIIAALGVTLGVARPELYAIAVGTSALTAFGSPYLIRHSHPIADRMHGSTPRFFRAFTSSYHAWITRVGDTDLEDPERKVFRDAVLRTTLYGSVSLGFVVAGGFLSDEIQDTLAGVAPLVANLGISAGWLATIFLVAPFAYLWSVHVRRAVRSLARLAVPRRVREHDTATERLLRRTFGVIVAFASGVAVIVVTAPFVESPLVLIGVVVTVLVVSAFFGRSLHAFHRELERTLDRLTSDSKEAALKMVEESKAWGLDTHSLVLSADAAAVGRSLTELRLRELTGASVLATEHEGRRSTPVTAGHVFHAGERVFLLGDESAILRAEEILRGEDLGIDGGVTYVAVRPLSPLVGRDLAAYHPATSRPGVLRVRREGHSVSLTDAILIEPGDVLVAIGSAQEIEDLKTLAAGAEAPAPDTPN